MNAIAKRLKICRPALPNHFYLPGGSPLDNPTKITWIHGPAGMGKTCRVNGWLTKDKSVVVWYTFDKTDEDIGQFMKWFYEAALAEDEDVTSWQEGPITNLENELDQFCAIVKALPPNSYIVFDDFHNVMEIPFFADLIRLFSTDHLTQHLLVICHHSPYRLNIDRNGNIRSFAWRDFKWELPDTQNFLVDLLADCPPAYAHKIHEKSDGYISGILELANSTQVVDVEYFIPTLLNEYLYKDAQSLDEDELHLLLLLALLEPDLYKHVGHPKLEVFLTQLTREGYVDMDRVNNDLMMQPLFKLFCRQLLNSFEDPAKHQIILHAAEILEKQDRLLDAAKLYHEAGDFNRLVRLTLSNAPRLFSQNQTGILSRLLDLVPENIQHNNGWFLYWQACLLQPKDPLASGKTLQSAKQLFQSNAEPDGIAMCYALQIDIELFQLSNHHLAEEHVKHLTELIRSGEVKFKTPDQELRVVESLFRGIMLRHPDSPDTAYWIEQQKKLVPLVRNKSLALQSAVDIGFFHMFSGDLAQAADRMHFARSLLSDKSLMGFTLTMYYRAEAWYQLLTDNSEEGYLIAKKGVEVAETYRIPTWRFQLLTQMLAAALSAGNSELEIEALSLLPKKFDDKQTITKSYYYNIMAWQAFLNDDINESLYLQELAVHNSDQEGMLYLQSLSRIAFAQIWSRKGQYDLAADWLHKGLIIATDRGFQNLHFMALCIQSHLALIQENYPESKKFLKQAFALAAKKAYVNYVWWRNTMMADLCHFAIKEDIETSYAKELVVKRHLVPSSPPIDLEDWPWLIRIYTFGRFSVISTNKPKKPVNLHGKLLLLLKCIITFGARDVPIDQVVDIIWSDTDADAGHGAFKTAIRRLRQNLGDKRIFVVKDNRISINDKICWLDTWAFRRTLNQSTPKEKKLDQLLQLYRGEFLKGDEKLYSWVISEQEKFKKEIDALRKPNPN